ncbi:MAG: hypothetical protein MUC73_10555 [Cyclobacteriaceae bacterium]|nr:hypothetical protein [Cyclobacteriaceae bacterium]
MKYTINNIDIHYEAQGKIVRGDDCVLINNAIDLTRKTNWHKEGYTVAKLFDEVTFHKFLKETKNLLINNWKRAGLNIPFNFELEQYHTLATDWEIHLKALEYTKLIPVQEFPINIKLLENRISQIIGEELEVRNPFDNQTVFHFRIIRPLTYDNNPLHRDVWLEDYKDCVNLYIPIAGSNELSSLILIPGSHYWPDSVLERTESGAVINGIKFNVPAVTAIHCNYEIVRPNPILNEVLIFSPYLIHGGAVNLNASTTRISIEIRLWSKS